MGHFIGVIVPSMGQYVFIGHRVHSSNPVAEYVPGTHFDGGGGIGIGFGCGGRGGRGVRIAIVIT